MNFFSSDITRDILLHTAVCYVIGKDRRTESVVLRFTPDPQEGETPACENFYLSTEEPFGDSWMSLLDLLDKNDRITDAVLNELHASLALLDLPEQTDPSSLKEYFADHSKQFISYFAQRILTIFRDLLPERPALGVLYPVTAMLLADLMSARRGGSADSDLILRDIEAVRSAFQAAGAELIEARTYVRDVLILPHAEGLHIPPKVTADYYRNFCHARGTEDFYGKYSSAPDLPEEKPSPAGSGSSEDWKACLQAMKGENLSEIRLTSLAQFLHFGIQDLLDRDHELRVCDLCGNYFDTHYASRKLCCTRLYKKTGVTCTEYSAHNKFRIRARVEKSIALEYTRAYNQLYARVRTGKTSSDTPYFSRLRNLYDEYLARYNACTEDTGRAKILDEYKTVNRELLTREQQERKDKNT